MGFGSSTSRSLPAGASQLLHLPKDPGRSTGREKGAFQCLFSSWEFQTPLLSLSPKLSAMPSVIKWWLPGPVRYFHLSFPLLTDFFPASSCPSESPTLTQPGCGTSPLTACSSSTPSCTAFRGFLLFALVEMSCSAMGLIPTTILCTAKRQAHCRAPLVSGSSVCRAGLQIPRQ